MNVYVMESCKRLAKEGYVVDIYTRSQDKNSPKIIDVSNNLRVIHIAAGEEKNVEKKKLINHIPEFAKNLFNFINNNIVVCCIICIDIQRNKLYIAFLYQRKLAFNLLLQHSSVPVNYK